MAIRLRKIDVEFRIDISETIVQGNVSVEFVFLNLAVDSYITEGLFFPNDFPNVADKGLP